MSEIKGPEGRHYLSCKIVNCVTIPPAIQMANTYSQISIQCIFAVNGRENLIASTWRHELHRYTAGIINNEGAKSLAVGGWQDHIHIFFGMPVTMKIADFISTVKASSSKWINENDFIKNRFSWQSGYGAFSYSKNQRDTIINYIIGQEEHHKQFSFKKEYLDLLQEFDVQYNSNYLFEFYE